MENKNMVHLHVHTVYSFLDGLAKIDELIAKAKSFGMTALAITDHNHLGGTYEFQKQCLDAGIKPILGYEGYFNEDIDTIAQKPEERKKAAATKALEDEVITQDEYNLLIEGTKNSKITKKSVEEKIAGYMPDLKQYHVIFLAMNQKGWQNIIKLQSESAERCTYNGRFICNEELMAKYSEGVMCTTACIASRIARYINRDGDYDKAEKMVLRWADIFKDRFYLELQPLVHIDQIRVNSFLISMGHKHNLPLIATNDVHYVNKEDHDDHDTLLCIGTGKKKSDVERLKYTNDFWLRSYDEIYYGLSSIKGVGAAVVDEIIANKPYMSLEDIFDCLPKKIFNKRVAVAMAKAGALDSFDVDGNRLAILNRIYDIRKDKDERYDVSEWSESKCIEFEKEVLNAPITYKPWWSTVKVDKTIKVDGTIISYREQLDKKGNTMVFAKLKLNGCEVEALIFASIYRHCVGVFDPNLNKKRVIHIKGKKDEKGKLIVNSAALPTSKDPWNAKRGR